MTNTEPTFFRRFEVFVPISVDKLSTVFHPVKIAIGFKGTVNNDSGMVLNLAEIDGWIQNFKSSRALQASVSRWDISRSIKRKLEKIIDHTLFAELRFDFGDFTIEYDSKIIRAKWHQHSIVQSNKTKWISPTTLTLKLKSKKWPLNRSQENKLVQSLRKINLDKPIGKVSSFDFESLEYKDLKLNLMVRI